VLLAIFCALIVASPAPVQTLRETLFDGYQRAFPRERKSAPVTIVEIDERALAELGQWPWPRSQIAELVERVAAFRPAAIGLDLLFSEPDRYSPTALATLPGLPPGLSRQLLALPGSDARLAEAIRGRNVVLAVAGLDTPDPRQPGAPQAAPVRWTAGVEAPLRSFAGALGSIQSIDRAAAGRGLISVDTRARIVRRVPLLAQVAGNTVPAFALDAWRVATAAPGFSVRPTRQGLLEIGVGDVRIPAQEDGSVWLRYAPHDPARFVSASALLAGTADPQLFESKLVLIALTGVGLLDYQATPLGERVPGVEVHAQLVEQIYDGTYLVRPAWAAWLEAAVLAGSMLLLMRVVPVRRVGASVATLLAIVGLLVAAALGAFLYGVLLDAGWPALGAAIAFAVLLAATLAEAERQRRALREAAARAAGELAAARRIQMGLLPDVRGLAQSAPAVSAEALLEPARTVGGDFYDCLQMEGNRLFFIVGDVSGKGMPAALFMALSKGIIKASAARGASDVGAVMRRAAAEISRDNPEQLFVTAFAGILDLDGGTLEYCNAGHEPPYVVSANGSVQRLPNADGPPLCTIQGFSYATERRQLAQGDCLCVVSDGVTEAMNERDELYGAHRLEHVLKFVRPGASPAEIVAAVRDDVRSFVGEAIASDDLTLLTVRWAGGDADATASASAAHVDLDAAVAGLLDSVVGRH
jgi:serine phosphatase RsbU (regulator of sigma subunit)/CHASE2 domain-containing sensor protein